MRLIPKGNPQEIPPEFSAPFMREQGSRAQSAIIGNTPFDEGELQASWELQSDERSFTVGSRLPYAPFPEFGTKGPIRPKRASHLVFYSKKYNRWVRVKEVAGQKAQFFVRNALNRIFPGAKVIRK